jgi:hypothetical protein
VLIDTSTLLRALQPSHPQRETVRIAIKTLATRGQELHLVPQNLIELWVVATRPSSNNGLGLSTAEATAERRRLKSMFVLLPGFALACIRGFLSPPLAFGIFTVRTGGGK